MQAARRIDQDDVGGPLLRRCHCIENDGGGVLPLLVCDNRCANPVSPEFELLDCGGAERVCGGKNDALAIPAEGAGQLRNAGRLSCTVDADHEDYRGRERPVLIALVTPELSLAVNRLQQRDKLIAERFSYLFGLLHPLFADPASHFVEYHLRRFDPRVGADQNLLELVPQLVVDLGAFEYAGHPPEESALGASERLLGSLVDRFVERGPFFGFCRRGLDAVETIGRQAGRLRLGVSIRKLGDRDAGSAAFSDVCAFADNSIVAGTIFIFVLLAAKKLEQGSASVANICLSCAGPYGPFRGSYQRLPTCNKAGRCARISG